MSYSIAQLQRIIILKNSHSPLPPTIFLLKTKMLRAVKLPPPMTLQVIAKGNILLYRLSTLAAHCYNIPIIISSKWSQYHRLMNLPMRILMLSLMEATTLK